VIAEGHTFQRQMSPISPGGVAPVRHATWEIRRRAVISFRDEILKQPQAESETANRFEKRNQRSDPNGHSRYCEPARFNRFGGVERIHPSEGSGPQAGTRKEPGEPEEGNGAWQSPQPSNTGRRRKTVVARLRKKMRLER